MFSPKTKMVIALLLTVSTSAIAQNIRKLTLSDAITLSINNSKQLQLNKAKIKEATGALQEAKDNRLPDAKASGSFLKLNSPNVDLKLSTPSSGNSGNNGQEGASPFSNISVDQVSYGIVSASLPVFSGFRIHYGIESQKYLLEAVKLDAANDTQAVIQNTIAAYGNLYKAGESVMLISESLKTAQKRVSDLSALQKNGVIVHNDVLKAQLQESNIKLSLMDAKNNLSVATVNMNLMLGLPEETQLQPDSNSITYKITAPAESTWEDEALQNRQDIAAISARTQATEEGIKALKGSYYPSLALTGNYIAADIPSLLTVTNVLGAGIGLQYNISSLWKTKAKIAQAEARKEQLLTHQSMLQDAIRLQTNKAYKDYVLSVQKIDVYAEAVTEAKENYKVTESKYNNQVATTQELLDADVAKLQAKLNYAFSKVDAMIAYKKLQQVSGNLKLTTL